MKFTPEYDFKKWPDKGYYLKEGQITLDFLIQETWRLAKYSKFVNISKIIEYATIALILFRASPKTRDLCTCLQWKVKTLIN